MLKSGKGSIWFLSSEQLQDDLFLPWKGLASELNLYSDSKSNYMLMSW